MTIRRTLPIAIFLSVAFAARSSAQRPDAAELRRLIAVREHAARVGPLIWPGFRADTIPMQFILPGRGALLVGWTGAAPAGYEQSGNGVYWIGEADRGAASTAIELNDRLVAQLGVTDTAMAGLVGLATHEAFHAYAQSSRRAGVKFGEGENSYYVSQYPVFDTGNESQFALELSVLRAALMARDARETTEAVRTFIAVREARQRGMNPNVALFEAMSELNEGLAEYAFIRAAEDAGGPRARDDAASRLATLLDATNRSVRLRFYVTGMTQALLLDRIGAKDWKQQLGTRNVTLQDLLMEAVGYRAEETRRIVSARAQHNGAALDSKAAQRVAELRTIVRARADSLLARPGLRVTINAKETGANSCGFDPQNLLQLGDGGLLHTRWVRICAGGLDLTFNAPVVQQGTMLETVAGARETVKVTAGGELLALPQQAVELKDVKIESPGLTGSFARIRLQPTANGVLITTLK